MVIKNGENVSTTGTSQFPGENLRRGRRSSREKIYDGDVADPRGELCMYCRSVAYIR